MMKPLLLLYYRQCILVCLCLCISKITFAQTDADALMIPKNVYCAGLEYDHSSWTNYWEGTLKRNNLNIGTLSTNTYSMVGNYGITNKLDILFSVPYITTNASAGTLKGQSGFQDLTMALKWLPVQTEIGKGIFSVHAILEGSIPLSNYEPNFLPVSIGLHSKTASLRALANYQTGRFFVTAAGQYVRRDDITIDQNSYYTTHAIYSNQVYMPDMSNFLFSTGYRSLKLNVEAILSQTITNGGFDIRRNDMPFPSNRMNWTTAGGLVKYSFQSGLEFTAGANYVLTGRNVGQSTNLFGGILYLIDFSGKGTKNTTNNIKK
jgi:hypothetical protein